MPKKIPYPLAIQLVCLHKLGSEQTFDYFSTLKDLPSFDLQLEFKTHFSEYEMDSPPEPWTIPTLLSNPELGLEANWSKLAAMGHIHSEPSEVEDKYNWNLTDSGKAYLKKLEALCNNSLFLKDMSTVFQKLLGKLVVLEETQREWLTLSNELGDVSESDISKKLQEHMKQLHRLNEFKDIAQSILGQLAAKSGKTMREMYEDLEIEDEEDNG